MSLLSRMSRNPKIQAFTLVELLVVVAIIGILLSLAVAVVPMVMKRAKSVEALTIAQNMVNGFTQYLAEYQRWPLAVGSQVEPTQAYAMLSGAEASPLNARQIVFVEFPVKYLDNPNPKLATKVLDPWKNDFQIRIDDNLDGVITDLPDVRNVSGYVSINATAAVWSLGPKGLKETNQRNFIVTW